MIIAGGLNLSIHNQFAISHYAAGQHMLSPPCIPILEHLQTFLRSYTSLNHIHQLQAFHLFLVFTFFSFHLLVYTCYSFHMPKPFKHSTFHFQNHFSLCSLPHYDILISHSIVTQNWIRKPYILYIWKYAWIICDLIFKKCQKYIRENGWKVKGMYTTVLK